MSHKILVVDDDPVMLNLASRTLTLRGFQVICAGDGAEAIRLAKAEKPDLLIMDINMPGMDGLSALEGLKHDETTRHIPILMISGLPAEVMTTDAFQNGAAAFIEKPFELARLACEVRTLLTERKV